MVDYYNLKKRVFGFDNFSGFPNPQKLKKRQRENILVDHSLLKKLYHFLD